jgi:hypothetical protein
MRLVKRTYVLPPQTIEKFEQIVSAGERSTVIGQLVQDWLESRQRDQLRREIIAGCRDMSEIYLAMEAEFHPLEEEVQHDLEKQSSKGRSRSRASRSRRRV